MAKARQPPSKNGHAPEGGRLGYDAVESTTPARRRVIVGPLLSEDKELTQSKRKTAILTARDLSRNYALAAWAIRKHLDYVSSFRFQSRNGVAEVDDRIEELMTWWARKRNCDVAQRHPLSRMLRLLEARAVVDGDCLLVKLLRGQLQAIEGDRIRTPTDLPPPEKAVDYTHGVKLDAAGRALAFAVCKRAEYGMTFERLVPAENAIQHGYFERFDQVRGISPWVSALNTLRDTYESIDYALAKAKVAQLFGLVTKRKAVEPIAPITETTEEGTAEADKKFEVDLGRGPFHLDLDTDEDAVFLENKTPSGEFQQFMHLVIAVSLLALDLDFSFFDSAHTNFFGSRAALMHYVRSCKTKRAALQEVLDLVTVWKLAVWIAAGLLVLPGKMTLADLVWQWVADGIPWWDPSKDIDGNIKAVRSGLDNPQRICIETGTDFFDNVDQIAEAHKYAESKGVTLSYDLPSSPASGAQESGDRQGTSGEGDR